MWLIRGISLHTSLQSLMEFDELQLSSMYLHDMFNCIITQIQENPFLTWLSITFRLICSNIWSNLVCILTNKWLHFRLRYEVICLKFLQNVVNRHNSSKHNYRKCHAHTYIFCHEKKSIMFAHFGAIYFAIYSSMIIIRYRINQIGRFVNIC